ncbi:MAG: hypothetical protein KDK91_28370 [Gammaproteobacteria bacterium]|nr:hypothetical protein [Gammaproteobacteria bacterium]
MNGPPRQSATQWAAQVTESRTSSESESQFCERKALVLATLRRWRSLYGEARRRRRRVAAPA